MSKFIVFLTLLAFSVASLSAGTIAGKVTAKESGEALIGANVYLKGTTIGAATDEDGMFYIQVDDGNYTIVCDFVGYATIVKDITVDGDTKVDFALAEYLFAQTINVIADRARERETPVAFTNVEKAQIAERLGSRDIPLVLNTTPSVYATAQGGGAGDARVNIRGFNQRNVAIMINGVPVNDMENGWVYWSNWDGLGDASASIQIQRGLSAVNLATPSIGGTMNIITDPTAQKAGISYKNEIGSGEFSKQTLFLNTGLVDNKFALTLGGVRKKAPGFIDKAWTDAWAYYLGAAYQLNDRNRLEVYAVGAPQRHGQRSYALNAAAFDHDFARDELNYKEEWLSNPKLAEQGIRYNANWNSVSPTYTGKQYWNGSVNDRYSANYLMERENYYHKPIVNLNWYSQLSADLSVYTTIYYSGGQGGGTGTFGSLRYDTSLWQRVPDWNATIERNVANIDTLPGTSTPVKRSLGILRNSVNNQWTVGAIAKALYKVSENLTTSFGLDWRTAEIEHYREVRDLLGGDYFYYTGNEFDTNPLQYYKKLGDKIDYDFTNTVNWIGGYAQGEYIMDQFTFYATTGVSAIKYDYINNFRKGADGNKLTAETDMITGFQLKGGASFRATRALDVFANAGFVSKVPIFDQVINDRNGTIAEDPVNEKFLSAEAGVNWRGLDNTLSTKANVYFTQWNDRASSIGVTNVDGSEGLIFLDGISSNHMGVELELAYQPVNFARLDAAASYGSWTYSDNVSGTYVIDYTTGAEESYTYYIKDLKVGDAPQLQFAGGLSVFPIRSLRGQLVWKYFADYYARFDPFSRTDAATAGEDTWKTPAYSLFDLHFGYDLPFQVSGVKFSVFAHVFNLFNTVYVQDATDNSRFNALRDENRDIIDPHGPSAAEVFLGIPRTFNVGFSIAL